VGPLEEKTDAAAFFVRNWKKMMWWGQKYTLVTSEKFLKTGMKWNIFHILIIA